MERLEDILSALTGTPEGDCDFLQENIQQGEQEIEELEAKIENLYEDLYQATSPQFRSEAGEEVTSLEYDLRELEKTVQTLEKKKEQLHGKQRNA